MKQIENIFSRTKTSSQAILCPNPKTPIIIDTREKQSLITANLIEQKANIKHELLEIGDYLINNTIIERKTFSDFISSITDKRLASQLKEMKKYPKQFLILENFDYNYSQFNIYENAIRGMMLSIVTDFQIPIIYTKNENDTARFLILIARRQKKIKQEYSLRQTKTKTTTEQQKQFILEGFPGVGPSIAKKLIKEFNSLKNIFNANEDELKKIFDKNKVKKFKDLLKD